MHYYSWNLYSNLTSCASYCFTPVAVETSGALGPATMNFIKDLGCRLTQATGEEATTRLLQRLCSWETLPRLWEHLVLSLIYGWFFWFVFSSLLSFS